MSFKTTDLCDEFSNELAICKQGFKSYGGKQAFSGPISTVKVLEDNVLVKNALETIPKGHVLVVDGGGSNNCALLGDRLAGIAVKRSLAGIIVYGCVRDTADLAHMDVGVLALGSNPTSIWAKSAVRSEEHTSELQSRGHIVCRLLLEQTKH